MSASAELDGYLDALRELKPPGVTKTRVTSIVNVCVENVKMESVLVQKIFTHFRRSPGTHKLGVLYVIDSVTRKWIELAGANGQDIASSDSQDGTFAAGVRRVTDHLPSLMNDIIQTAPEDQKDKISKLIEIWERANTFPTALLSKFKAKLDARKSKAEATANPSNEIGISRPSTAKVQAHQDTNGGPPGMTFAHNNTNGVHQNDPKPSVSQVLQGLIPQQLQTSSSIRPATVNYHDAPTVSNYTNAPTVSNYTNVPAAINPASAPTPVPAAPAVGRQWSQEEAKEIHRLIPVHGHNNPELMKSYVSLFCQMADSKIPLNQWAAVIATWQELEALKARNAANGNVPGNFANAVAPTQPGVRARSRSPAPRRDSPTYGRYDNGGYRQRSPIRGGSASLQDNRIPSNAPKWTDMDYGLPPDHIKVLSRTLFVGGVYCDEEKLRGLFRQFGDVQTCIVNNDKHIAFVKMYTRAEAVRAIKGMQEIHDKNMLADFRSVRWGVGFGPRDCSDYDNGVGLIPLNRLTEADRKWAVSAEHGGTGGKELVPGLVMEEPDIEIGAGVSSKAISARRGGGNETRRNAGGSNGNGNANAGHNQRNANNSPANRNNSGSMDNSPGNRNNNNNNNMYRGGSSSGIGAGAIRPEYAQMPHQSLIQHYGAGIPVGLPAPIVPPFHYGLPAGYMHPPPPPPPGMGR